MVSDYAHQLEKLGFRKWYEKRLTHAHGYLVLCIVAMIMIAALAESVSTRGPTRELVSDVALFLASGAIGAYGWVKYQMHMRLAEELAYFATCAHCTAYGKLEYLVLHEDYVRVKCKKCGHGWQFETRMFAQQEKKH